MAVQQLPVATLAATYVRYLLRQQPQQRERAFLFDTVEVFKWLRGPMLAEGGEGGREGGL